MNTEESDLGTKGRLKIKTGYNEVNRRPIKEHGNMIADLNKSQRPGF